MIAILLALSLLAPGKPYKGIVGTGATYVPTTVAVASTYQGVSASSGTYVDVSVSSIPAGALVVVFGATDGYNTGSSTVSGAGLTWTARLQDMGYVHIHTAPNPGGATSGTLRFTSGGTGYHLAQIFVLTGADSTQLSNNALVGWGPTTAFSVGLTAAGSSSFVLTSGYTWVGTGYTITPSGGFTNDLTQNNPNGGTQFSMRNTTPSTGTITNTGTLSASIDGHAASIEVRAPSAFGIANTYTTTDYTNPFGGTFTNVAYNTGDLLVVMIATQDNNALGVSGGSNLGTWTSRTQVQNGTDGYVGIITNVATGNSTGQTITPTGPTYSAAATLLVFTGADTTNLSNTGAESYATTVPMTITDTLVGSSAHMVSVFKANAALTAGSPGANTTSILWGDDTANSNQYTFLRTTNPTTGSTTTSQSYTPNAGDGHWGVSLEIRAQ